MSNKNNINSRFKSKLADKLLTKLKELMIVYRENLYHAQELQKPAYNTGVKLKNYASSDKVSLNSKYLKTQQNQKSEVKFFGPF